MSSYLPYPGLRPFRRDETDIFFGREEQTDQLLEKLVHSRFIAVVGPSGCGKSSLVKAGMIAALEAGFMVNAGSDWRVAEMRPGDHPLKNLADAMMKKSVLGTDRVQGADAASLLQATLRRGPLGLLEVLRETQLPEHTNILLLVDQFEEIFRYRKRYMADETEAFIAMLLASVRDRDIPLYIVITMRSDFLGDCARFYGLPEAMNDNQFLTPRLTRDQCKAAIEGPAEVFGGRVEPVLVNRLLNEMGPDPDQLPLMQHVMMRMWTRAPGSIKESGIYTQDSIPEYVEPGNAPKIELTLSDYEEVGGLTEALSNHADEAFAELDEEQRRICEVMFRCLSERGPDQRDTRRPVRVKEVAEVCGVPPDRIIDIVEVFRRQGRSFITPPAEKPLDSDKILDISHESLIRQWKRMSKWVGKEAGSADMYRNLERTALRWESGHAAPWGTPDLDLALKWKESENPTSAWAKRYGTDYELAMKFLDASEQKREADEQEEIERRKRELEQAQALAVERERAEEKTRSARNTKIYLGIMAGLLCLMIVSAFLALDKSRTTRIALQEVDEARKRAEDSQLKAEEARDEADRLLQVSKSQTLAFRAPRQQRLGRQDERAALLAREAYILNSRFGGQTLSQFDEALRTILSADHFSHILHAHQARVNSVALSKNGTTLASAGDDKTILLWNLNNPTIEPIELKGNHRKNNSVVFSPDGATLASISDANKLLLWDYENPAATPKVLDSYQGKINSMAFSPLGSRLASAGSDGTVWLWDLNNSTNKPEAFKAHEGPVLSAAFSPDGATLASTGKDQAVRLWNLKNPDSKPIQLKNPKLKETKDPEPLIFNSVIFSPIGKTVAATSGSTLYLWERKYPVKRPRFLKGHSDTIHSIAFRPDGNMIATASQDNTVRLWDPERGVADPHAALGDLDMAEAVLEGFEGRVNSVVFSSDGNTLAAASDDNSLRIWDLRKPVAKPSSLEGSQKNILSVCFSPDGHTLASAGADKIVRLWDLKNPSAKSKELRGHDFQVNSVAFSPDGTILASASDDGSVRLWDLTNSANQLESFRNHKGSVWSVAFSPDGKILASAGEDGVVCLRYLDKTAREPIHLKEHRGAVYSVTFSPDAATLASAGADRTVRLWDLNNSERKHKFFWDHEGQVYSVAFSPDGATLAASGDDQNIYLWDLKNLTKKPIVPPLSAHKGSIYSVIFSPTGDIVASAGADRVVRLWNLKNLDAEPVVLKSHKGWIESVAFSPDGRTLASAGDDKTILLHLAPTSALADIVCEKVWRNLNMREWVKFVGAKEDYEKTCPDLPAP